MFSTDDEPPKNDENAAPLNEESAEKKPEKDQ